MKTYDSISATELAKMGKCEALVGIPKSRQKSNLKAINRGDREHAKYERLAKKHMTRPQKSNRIFTILRAVSLSQISNHL